MTVETNIVNKIQNRLGVYHFTRRDPEEWICMSC